MRAKWLKIRWDGPLTEGWPLATGGTLSKVDVPSFSEIGCQLAVMFPGERIDPLELAPTRKEITLEGVMSEVRKIEERQERDLLPPGETLYLTPQEWEWLQAHAATGGSYDFGGRPVVVDTVKAQQQRKQIMVKQWARANPAIGTRVSEQAVKNAFSADPDQEQTP